MKTHPYHELAVTYVKDYFSLEVKLIQILKKIESERVFSLLGYPSMYSYCTESLKLSESQSYRLIGVSRSCAQVPELDTAITSGKLNPSKVKKILSVLTNENANVWIEKALTLPTAQLEKEVALENPEKAIQEKLKPVTPTKLELKLGISYELRKKLERAQQITGKKNIEETLEVLVEHFLERKDPVEKAKRNGHKPVAQQSLGKVIPTSIRHQVVLRDRGKCQYRLPSGKVCQSGFFTEIHHILPFSYGGKHELSNLTTFCSAHHKIAHHRPNHTGKQSLQQI